MRPYILALIILPLAFAEEKSKPLPKLSDADARAIRELQLTISQATITQKQAQIDFDAAQKAANDSRAKLDALVKAKEAAVCNGGKIREDLSCSAPPVDQAKAKGESAK